MKKYTSVCSTQPLIKLIKKLLHSDSFFWYKFVGFVNWSKINASAGIFRASNFVGGMEPSVPVKTSRLFAGTGNYSDKHGGPRVLFSRRHVCVADDSWSIRSLPATCVLARAPQDQLLILGTSVDNLCQRRLDGVDVIEPRYVISHREIYQKLWYYLEVTKR